MRMNRRNVLIGVGAIVAGGGAALGTGAFSQVEAQRQVNVTTEGDADAVVGLEITSELLSGGVDDTISFDVDDLNVDAITRFDGGFEVTNNTAAEDNLDINLTINDDDGNSITTDNAEDEEAGMYLEIDDSELTGISADESATMDVVFNLDGVTEAGESYADTEFPDEITIIADGVDTSP